MPIQREGQRGRGPRASALLALALIAIGASPAAAQAPTIPERDSLAAKSEAAMVVGTTGRQAQDMGLAALKRGGNAVDAALTTAFGQVVLSGGSWVSFAGVLNMVIYDAEKGEVACLNAAFNTVKGETDYQGVPGPRPNALELKPDAIGHHNGRTVPVPGFMRGAEAAHKRFGALPWKALLAPAIKLAEEGFEIDAGLAGQLSFRRGVLSRFPKTKAHFVTEQGRFLKQGDRFRQPALARTLRRVAEGGAAEMYTGAWAKAMVAAVQGIGGRLTLEDMAAYEARWVEPVTTRHAGFSVYAPGLPGYGGVDTIEALNLFEAAGLAKKPHYAASAESFYWLSQILRAGSASRADPSPSALRGRLGKGHALALWATMRKRGGWEARAAPKSRHSDGVVVIDAAGNMAAAVHSINTVCFGETGLVIDGVSISDALNHQLDVARQTKPGGRLPDPTSPLVILKDGRPFGAFAGIGAGLHQRMLSVLVSVLDFHMSPGEALAQPALGFSINLPGIMKGRGEQTLSAGRLPPAMIKTLKARGLRVVSKLSFAGYVAGAIIDAETGERRGGTSGYLGGRPVGY